MLAWIDSVLDVFVVGVIIVIGLLAGLHILSVMIDSKKD